MAGVVLGLILGLSRVAFAQTTINVDTTTQGPVSGSCSLHDAILIANGGTPTAGSTCATGAGPYTIVLLPVPSNATSTTYTLSARDNANRVAGTPDINSSNVIIQGQGAGATIIQSTNTSAMAIFSVTGGTAAFTGLTVTGGNPGLVVPCCYLSATLNIDNTTFSNNSWSGNSGGAISISYGNPVNLTITNSLFSGNSASNYGGALYFDNYSGGTLSISNSSFTNNTSINGGNNGGAIAINRATSASLQYLSFNSNSASYGGAVWSNVPTTLSNSSFTNNTASQGGGLNLSNGGAQTTITASTFSGNTASDAGGGIFRYNGVTGQVTQLVNTTVSGNTANNGGGGIYVTGCGINNSCGGGLDLNNVTITGNTAKNGNNAAGGGGLALANLNPNDFFTFENTIIAGNADTSNLAADCSTVKTNYGVGFTSQGYNLVGNDKSCDFISTTGDQVGTNSLPLNPMLGPLQNNGAIARVGVVTTFVCGPGGQTCPVPSTQAPQLGSRAIDASNPATPGSEPAACATTDQIGQTRPQGAACDIGAFETDIDASPLTLNFPPTSNPATSSLTVTLTNYANSGLTISSVASSSSDFTPTGCTGALTVSNTCTITVVFAPTAADTGLITGTLTILATDGSSPVVVNLAGQANVPASPGAPFAQLTPAVSVAFGNQGIGSTSAAQTVTLANAGTTGSTLTISGIAATGDFAVSGTTCGALPATLVAPASCTIGVTFTPTIVGAEVGSLTVTDDSNNVASSTQTLELTGTGVGISLSSAELVFPDTGVPGGTNTQSVTLTNTSVSYLTVGTPSLTGPNSGDFAVSANTCTTPLTPSGTCTISVTFSPSATGLRAAILNFTITGGPASQAITVALSGAGVASQVITVNTTAQFAGSSLDCTLGDAITAAQTQSPVNGCAGGASAGNTINLPAGTYHLTHVNNYTRNAATPDINTTLTIQGAGAATTILQRDAGAPGFEIFSLTGGTLTLNDLTVTGGYPGLSVPCCYLSATLNIHRSIFSNNSWSGNSGGAISISYGNPVNLTITNSLFSGNSASNYGGALYFDNYSGGTLSISNSSFTNNISLNGGNNGGAIAINRATSASLQYLSFTSNSASYGGAVWSNVPTTLSNSSFTNNTASQGGGLNLSNSGAQTTITASTFSGNTASDAGGGIFRYFGSLGQSTRLVNVTLNGNTAGNGGGGIYMVGCGINNSCGAGLDLNNVTIAGNTANNSNSYAGGGGLAFQNMNPDDFFTFENSIIAGNTDTSNLAPDCSTVKMGAATFASQGYNLVGNSLNCSFIPSAGDQVGNNSVPINPRLGTLANNAPSYGCGPSLTCTNQTQALLLGSPAIDAGNPTTPANGPAACATSDADGVARPQGTACDVGAFEADINVSPLSLSFPPTANPSSSAPQTITFTNYANATLTIASVTSSSPDFTIPTNGCTGSLTAGSSCTITVVFSPQVSSSGATTGTLTIQTSDASNPVLVSLAGQANVTGVPFAQLTPPVSLSLGSQVVGTASSPQTVTLTNTGNATLTISSIATTGDFATPTNTCGSSVLAGASCAIAVTFTPTVVGPEVGSLVVTDDSGNVTNSTQTLSLTGTGIGASLSTTTLFFPDLGVGVASAPQTVTLTNTTAGTLTLSVGITQPSTDFGETNNCSSVAASGTCTISVTFTPTTTGVRTATLTITGGPTPLAVSLIGGGVAAQVIVVNTTAQFAVDLTNDCTLADAIKAAQSQSAVNGCAAGSNSPSGNTIYLPAGTFHLTHVNSPNHVAAFPDLNTTLTLQGAGAGTTIIQRDSNAPGFEIFSLAGGTLTLNDLTVTGGQPGLGVPCCYLGATLNINRSTFSNNSLPGGSGGAISIYGYANINLNIVGSLFSGNTASNHGGAIYYDGYNTGTLSISNSSFTNNSSSTPNYYNGGAIDINAGVSATIQSSLFNGNSATYGGAVYSYIPLTISNSSFTNNSAYQGGGLDVSGSGVITTITASTFSGNTASESGGGIFRAQGYNNVGQVTKLANTTLSGNTATNGGGGLYVVGCGLSSSCGGGLDLNNVTVTGNTAHNSNNYAGGGGLAFQNLNPNEFFTFENTIVAGNTDTSNAAPNCSTVQIGSGAGFTSQGYNLIGDNTNCTFTQAAGDQVGTSSVPIDPRLAGLGSNGASFTCGPSLTCTNQTQALLLGSPAIDAGNPASAGSEPAACATADANGTSRPQGTACDIGAFEADIDVAPLLLSFPPQTTGVASAAETVTFTNYANANLTITSVASSSPDFTIPADGCTGSLTAGGSCTISVVFKPTGTVTGTSTGQLTIQTSDASNPVTVNLTGQANVSAPFAQLTPPVSLSLGSVALGATSAAQTVTLANTGTTGSTLTISNIATTGDFAVSSTTCGALPATLAAPASCTISVTFTPTLVGVEVGSLVVTDNSNNVANSTQNLILTGTGAGVGQSVTALTFPDQGVGTTSSPQSVTLTNNTGSTLASLSATVSGTNSADFSVSANTCSSVAANGTCTISVTFTPTAAGPRTATLTITGGPVTQTVALMGGGVAAQVITVNTTSQFALSALDCTLGDAIKAAQTQLPVKGCVAGSNLGNTINLPAGTFDLIRVNNFNRAAAFPDINTTLTIQGAGAGTTIIQRDPNAPSFAVFSLMGGSLTLNDLTVKGGQPGLYAPSCCVTLNINRSAFASNLAPNSDGGALYLNGNGALTISNGLFSGNSATFYGGAIYINGGTVSIANSSFINNSTIASNYYGGAIKIETATSVSIQSCSFSANGSGYGGAIYDTNAPLTISGSAFTNNSSKYNGGALYVTNSGVNATITASTFSGNQAGGAGGAIYRNNGTSGQVTSLTNVTISGNTASSWGGGMAVYSSGGLELNNVTIANNTAGSSPGGGGIAFYGLNAADTYKVENTLIASNADTSNSAPDCSTTSIGSGSLTSQGYNLIGNNTGCTFTAAAGDQVGTASTPINPFLDVLAVNGAPSYVCGPNSLMCTGNQTQALITGSTAVDAGNPVAPGSGAPACAATDEQGVTRPQGTACDIGAFEGSVPGTADLLLSMSASASSVVAGNNLTYTLTVTSSGPDIAPGITLTDTLPAGVTFVSSTPSTGSCSGSTVVTCNLGNMVSGGTANVSIVVSTTVGGTLVNSATLSSTATDPTPGDNTVTVTTTVVPTASANLSTATLTFGDQLVGATSLPQDVILTNPGTDPLTIVSVVASGDFAQMNNCGGSLAAGASCTIGVTFTPTATGTRTGTLTLTDSAGNSPQIVTLSGTGVAGVPVVTESAPSLTFGSQVVGTTSTALTVTLTNGGTASLNFTGFTASGDFALDTSTTTCSTSTPLAFSTSCTVGITFTPIATGARTGALTISDNAGSGTQVVGLSGTGIAPGVSLTPSSLTFGSQAVGTTSGAQSVTLTNTGTSNLTFTSISVSGDFGLDASTTCSISTPVPPTTGNTCTIAVTFTPTVAGTRTGTVTISDNASGGTQTIALSGAGTGGVSGLTVTLTPSTLTFGSQVVNTTSAAKIVTLTNTGGASITFTTLAPSGDFALDGSTTTCSIASPLAASGTCTVGVTFTPVAAGTRTGVVTISASTGSAVVALSGTGTAPGVSLAPSSLTFGSQVVGTTSGVQSVTLTNAGSSSLTITALSASGDFALDPTTTCSASSPVPQSGTCKIDVTFTPTATGTRTGGVTISDDASGGTQVVALSGTGTAPGVSLSPSNLTFASQVVGTTSAAQSVTLTNTGTSNLTLSALNVTGDFALDTATTCSTSTPVTPNGTCKIAVTFTPTATGTRAGAVTITDNASSNPQTIILAGTGGSPAVTVSLTLVFPNQNVNEVSAPETVTVTNSGTSPLTVSNVGISGDFAIQNNTCTATIAVGATCTISITFTPTTTGLRTGNLTITDNAPGSPHTVAISGTGVIPGASPSPAAIDFPGNPLNMNCPVKTVTLTNTGTGQLNIANVVATAPFSVASTSTCGSTLAPSLSCTLDLQFTPAAVGTVAGSLTITSDAPTSPTVVALTGTGTPACALLTSAQTQTVLRGTKSVDFTISDQKPSCTPDPIQLTCTVDNPAICALAQTTIQPTGSTNLTVANLEAVGAQPVHVEVVKRSDFRVAAVDMQVLIADFATSEYPPAATVSAGQTASYALTLSPVNGLKGSIQFSCQGAPVGATCSVSPSSVTMDGTSPAQATVRVITTARALGAPRVPPVLPLGGMPRWVWLLGLAVLAVAALYERRKGAPVIDRRYSPALVLAAILMMALAWAACGGGEMTVHSPGTPAGSYSLTVTGTYVTPAGQTSNLSHDAKVTLTVN